MRCFFDPKEKKVGFGWVGLLEQSLKGFVANLNIRVNQVIYGVSLADSADTLLSHWIEQCELLW